MCFGGGGQNVNQMPEIPAELKPLISGSVSNVLGLQQGLPLGSFARPNPAGTAGLSPMQSWAMNQIGGLDTIGYPAQAGAWGAVAQLPEIASQPLSTPGAEAQQIRTLGSVIGGPVGSSPATKAGMEAWRSSVLPTVENEMVNAGLGRSGDLLKAVGGSASQAFFPLIKAEIDNRMAGAQQLGNMAQFQTQREMVPREQTMQALQFGSQQMLNMAQQQFDQKRQTIEEAMNAGRVTRDIAQQQLDSAHEEFLRLAALSEAGTLGPLGQVLPSLIGSRSRSTRRADFLNVLGK